VGLLPKPGTPSGVSATFASVADALAAANAIVAGTRRPSVLEFLDGACIAAINAFDPASTLPAGAGALLLVQSDEIGRAHDDVEVYAEVLRAGGAATVTVAHDTGSLEQLMSARRLLHPAVQAVRGGSLNEDVTVPRSQLPALLIGLAEIALELGVPISTGGHIGDGNLHPVIGYNPEVPAELDAAHVAFGRVIALAISLDGSASGEHGIGVLKRAHLDDELGPVLRDLQRRVKAAFDPNSLLNPGKKL
jgi:glycolate oxidase